MISLIALDAIIFAYERSLARSELLALVNGLAFVPAEPSFVRGVLSPFFHENTLHLVVNLAALWIFGPNVEDQLGRVRFLALWAAGALAGSYAAAWGAPASLVSLVGANGGVAAVIGAYIAMFPYSRVLCLTPARGLVDAIELPAVFVSGVWFGTLLVGGLGRVTDPWTGRGDFAGLLVVVGGLIVGLVAGRVLRLPARRRVEWWGA